jgi:HAMP domain-containing protein
MIKTASIRTKLLSLVAFVALLVGGASALYSSIAGGRLLREQVERRGHYIAVNLAYNSKYGVLTEDKTLLTQLLEGALSAGAGEGSDVVAASIRDTQGAVLAQKGAPIRNAPPVKSEGTQFDALTEGGEPVLLFRAPITTTAAGGDLSAELGLPGAPSGRAAEELKGVAEVAISRRVMDERQRANLLTTMLVALLLFTVGSAAGWFAVGRWFNPVQRMVKVAGAVAKGDLTERMAATESLDEMGVLAGSLD